MTTVRRLNWFIALCTMLCFAGCGGGDTGGGGGKQGETTGSASGEQASAGGEKIVHYEHSLPLFHAIHVDF